MANANGTFKVFRPWETSTPTCTTLKSCKSETKSSLSSPTSSPPNPITPAIKHSPFYGLTLPVPTPPFNYPFGFAWAGSPALCSPAGNDSGYHSEHSPLDLSAKTRPQKQRRNLNPVAVAAMERWYERNRDHPYPDDEVVNLIARTGNITTAQVRKWMANKRVRSHNTLSYNQASLVRRGRTRKEPYSSAQPDSTTSVSLRHAPYPMRHHHDSLHAGLPYPSLAHRRGPLSLLASPRTPSCQSTSPGVSQGALLPQPVTITYGAEPRKA